MCQFQQICYSCGHTRLVLSAACKFFETPKPLKKRLWSAHYHNSCEVTSCTSSSKSCGQGAGTGYTCTDYLILKPLLSRLKEIDKELASFASRGSKIADIFSVRGAPEIDWKRVERKNKKVDLNFLKAGQQRRIDNFPNMLRDFSKKMHSYKGQILKVFDLQVKAVLAGLDGDDFLIYETGTGGDGLLTLGIELNLWERAKDLRGFGKLGVQSFFLLERAYYLVRKDAHTRLQMLEETAVHVGLDAVSWELPRRGADRKSLESLIERRVVRPIRR
jgi:hypothetical protein